MVVLFLLCILSLLGRGIISLLSLHNLKALYFFPNIIVWCQILVLAVSRVGGRSVLGYIVRGFWGL